jgi:ABC-2 type transport system ATP-binding protein
MSVVCAHELSKSFGRTEAVRNLNLGIPEGSIFSLVGPNGAGKTTTIKTLLNILRPTSGTAEVLGTDSRHLGPREFACLGYVSENQELPGWMTVDYFLRWLKPFYPGWDEAWAEELLRQLDLPRARRLRELSRGMRIKAAMAASLAYHPKLIVLDEPFGGVDSLVRDELIEALLERCAGATVLISSHDLAEIESFTSHIGYIEAGRLRFCEEMTSLAGRFREIELTFDNEPSLPSPWPQGWLEPSSANAVLRFVDSQFNPDSSPAEIRRAFPSARGVSVDPMPLRAIFVSLAKAARKAA